MKTRNGTNTAMTPSATKTAKSRNGLWVWVGLAFGLMLAAWSALFVIAAHNKVEEVPLQTQPKTAP